MESFKDADLSKLTTIRIGGRGDLLLFPEGEEDLVRAVLRSREEERPLLILGGGSNTILGDVKGIVVSTKKMSGIDVKPLGEGRLKVEVLCGTPLKEITSLALRENLRGIYKLMGFPATVGGAVAMNAGAFGTEISEYLVSVRFVNWEGKIEVAKKEDLSFSYRSSPFPKIGVVLSCEFVFERSSFPVLEDYKRIREIRKKTQPINLPTSGSTFKNPYPEHAGKLLEKVGMKGYRVGDVAFSEVHANFLVNLGRGRFCEVLKIVGEAKRRVFEEFGIRLEEEVRIVEDSGSDGWKVL